MKDEAARAKFIKELEGINIDQYRIVAREVSNEVLRDEAEANKTLWQSFLPCFDTWVKRKVFTIHMITQSEILKRQADDERAMLKN